MTEAFDFHASPGTLLEFIWRYSQACSSDRGHDPTVIIASPDLESPFRDAIRSHVRSQLGVDGPELDKAVSAHYEPGHATAIEVHPQPPPESTKPRPPILFIVSRPVSSTLYLEGRGTRGYWALDVAAGRVVFLKDTWCTWPTEALEGNILAHLNEKDVRNVPQREIHGLVPHDFESYHRTGQ